MSRIANKPVDLPKGVELKINASDYSVKGPKGSLENTIPTGVSIKLEGTQAKIEYESDSKKAIAGTTRALLQNAVTGISTGFEKKLQIIGVGYRAQAKGKVLNLSLGFSHPVDYPVPEGITIETPSQTEIVVKGSNKELVGQVAADIRAYRPPEPYKGKGVRYVDEYVMMKEAKKK